MNNDPPSTAAKPNAGDIAEGMPLNPWPQAQKVTPAYCPRCHGIMDSKEPACPHCGGDIQLPTWRAEPGFAYSRPADYILFAGAVAAGLGGLVSILAAIGFLLTGNCGAAFLMCPLAFFVHLALMIVFIRVQRIGPP